ncbi:MAG: MinD/ParA family protein [Candidatus Cloacimonetes bacterium]|jgi:flagellar biosynthesis protein FlhG|nr:MinD/ParA family protein [Candidatus Cloacimonadota bacterium]MDD4157204.1 MinD/ParA family protein [Candidatus Cloacimonadota bacterium]
METNNQSKNLQKFIKSDKGNKNNKLAKLIAITSGKGGVGKTNFILNLAIAMAIRGKKILLIDADMNLSNIDVLLGIYPEYTLSNLMDELITVDKLLVEGPRGIKILPASSGDIAVMQNQKQYQQALIQVYMDLRSEFDYILIDTGAGISDYTIDFVLSADKIVVITTPEPTAITDAYAMIKVLFYRTKFPNISLVVNMAQTEDEAKNIYNKINLIVQHFLNKTISNLGFIPLDKNIKEAVNDQIPLIIKRPRSIASASIHNIGISILKEDKE